MSDSFDPYRKWLGIPPQDQPPHYYRLLGIEPFEPDGDVIAIAVDGRMALIKNFQSGKYSKQSQKLLNEIAKAKVCLLNPEKKAEYDETLRQRLPSQKKAADPLPPKTRPPQTAAAPPVPMFDSSSVASRVSVRAGKRPSWQLPVAMGAVVVLIAGALVFFLSRDAGKTGENVAKRPVATDRSAKPQQPAVADGQNNAAAAEKPQPPVTKPAEPKPEPAPSERPGPGQKQPDPPHASNSRDKPAEQPADTDGPTDDGKPARLLGDLLDPAEGDKPDNPEATKPADKAPGRKTPPADKRLPVPERSDRETVEQKIRDIFKNEFDDAKTPDGKLALAAKLDKQARASADAPTDRFVLMQMACETAAAAGEVTDAFDMVDRMQKLYRVDPLPVKAHVLGKAIDSLRSGPQGAEAAQEVVDRAMKLAESAADLDDFDVAGHFTKLAISAAKKAKNVQLQRELNIRDRKFDRQKVQFASVKQALDALKATPDDPDSNSAAGRWYCFTKSDWQKGLPYLAKGKDPTLADLARQDTQQPTKPNDQAKLADGWWDRAEKEESLAKAEIQCRAESWYKQALPKLKGLDKVRVEKRLEEATAAVQPSATVREPEVRGVVQPGNIASATNGVEVTGVERGGQFLFDGNKTPVFGKEGHATSKWPSEWIVVFPKVYQLRTIRLRLWDGDDRFYRYTIATSADGREYSPLVDRSRGEWRGWQQVQFPPRAVKAIRFRGIYNSDNPYFQVVEFEAYCIPPREPPK